MEYIFGKETTLNDPNRREALPESIVRPVTTSWTSQAEAFNNQMSIAVPYDPIVTTVNGISVIEPIFYMPILDRMLPGRTSGSSYPRVNLKDGNAKAKWVTPFPLSAKQNLPWRYTATDIHLTIAITPSSLIQGTLAFFLVRNLRTANTVPEKEMTFPSIVDSANALAIMNLATDRNVTIKIGYDELYNMVDYGFSLIQEFQRGLVCYPLTPILSSTDTPTTIFFSVLYGTGIPRGEYLINAPNLTLCYKKPPDQVPTETHDRLAIHRKNHSLLINMLKSFMDALAAKFKIKWTYDLE